MAEPFLSEIRIMSFGFPPKGWALCDGQLLPISQNTALFSLLGTFYGGDGKSTFALPNLEDSTPMCQGQGGASPTVLSAKPPVRRSSRCSPRRCRSTTTTGETGEAAAIRATCPTDSPIPCSRSRLPATNEGFRVRS
jgi:microcystin-dependent protein